MTDRLARNKKNAIAFYDLMFDQCEPGAAIEQFAGAEYIQHNPHVAEGKAAFVEYFERMAADLETRFALSAAPPPLDAAIQNRGLREAAFEAERLRWREAGELGGEATSASAPHAA